MSTEGQGYALDNTIRLRVVLQSFGENWIPSGLCVRDSYLLYNAHPPHQQQISLALPSIRTIRPTNFQATDDTECSFCFGGFLVRSYLGRLDCVEVNRVRGSWNLE